MRLDAAIPPVELLSVVGPEAASPPAVTLEEAREYCRGLANSRYENFSVLTGLVPAEGGVRDDFAAVYAFCRWADDLGDETGTGEAARGRSLELLAWWRRELQACFEGGEARHPVFVALAETARKFRERGLTSAPFDDLIRAFEQDQRVTRYETWEELLGYCRLSADPVGRIVLTLGGWAPPALAPENAERYRLSDLTCSALQLINFWQDVRRDLFERDRVYVPRAQAGFGAEELRAWAERPLSEEPDVRVRYIKAVRTLVERTEGMFREARTLPRMLDERFGPIVWLFGAGGEAILRKVEGAGCTTLWKRPKLSKAEKGLLVGEAWVKKKLWRG